MPSKSLVAKWSNLLVVFLPLFSFLFGWLLIRYAGVYDSRVETIDAKTAVISLTEVGQRYFFMVSFLLLICVCIGTIIASLWDYVKFLDAVDRTDTRTLSIAVAAVLMILVSTIVFIVVYRDYFGAAIDTDFRIYYILGRNTFGDAIELVRSSWSIFFNMRVIGDILVPLSLVLIVFGALSTNFDRKYGADVDPELLISAQIERLNYYLYLGAALCVAGLVFINSWMQWPSFAIEAESKPAYEKLIKGLSTVFGLYFSVFIASYYIPASLVLNHRVRKLARAGLRQGNVTPTVNNIQKWIKDHGLNVYEHVFYRIVGAIVAPVLTGILGGLLSTVK